MSLETYHRKRDFSRTNEPRGEYNPQQAGHSFLVQKHAARRLHYDFRLQMGGVLKSWAVPKGPSLDPKEKRLAVETEDHPLDYASFEGVIPDGSYGAGTVLLWDRGEWEVDGDPLKAYAAGKISFQLHGERLQGGWTLVRMRGKSRSGKEWLLVKDDDEYAQSEAEPTEDFTDSVASARTMESIADEGGASRTGTNASAPKKQPLPTEELRNEADPVSALEGKGEASAVSAPAHDIDLAKVAKARKAAMPDSIKPQLATLYQNAPEGDNWLHEIKYDGYRLLVFKQGKVRLVTRTGKDWTSKFPAVVQALAWLPDCIIDGELVFLEDSGISNFEGLQQVMQSGKSDRLVFYAFDMPFLMGYDLKRVPLAQRKALLSKLFGEASDGPVRFGGHIVGSGEEVFHHACEHRLEGIISKRADGPYEEARSKNWRKIKCTKRQEFVIAGFTPPKGSRQGFGALLLAYHEDGELKYAGKVGTGFKHDQLLELHKKLTRIARKTAPIKEDVEEKQVTWVKPELIAEVEFTEWTRAGRLRHPSFVELRFDKPASEIVRETPVDAKAGGSETEAGKVVGKDSVKDGVTDGVTDSADAKSRAASAPAKRPQRTGKAPSGEKKALDASISNPDKLLYRESGITKADVAEYYAAIAEHMLPYVANRPLTLVRCPQGHTRHCFFQKHLGDSFSESVKPVEIEEKSGPQTYAYVNSAEGLVGLVQMGALEIHAWGSRIDDVERPDNLVFDLDPGEGVGWEAIVDAAYQVRDFLHELKLESFVRTSGGKGLHVVVPIELCLDWEQAKAFCKAVAQRIAEREPERYVATLSKAKRKNRVFIDYLRNGRGSTSICNFSTRSRAGAPIATPLGWDELEDLPSAKAYTLDNIFERLQRLDSDPWSRYQKLQQPITPEMKQRLKIK
jgi:bifunctional non-homologous end joining protein LigD